jgi:hypothetical protein
MIRLAAHCSPVVAKCGGPKRNNALNVSHAKKKTRVNACEPRDGEGRRCPAYSGIRDYEAADHEENWNAEEAVATYPSQFWHRNVCDVESGRPAKAIMKKNDAENRDQAQQIWTRAAAISWLVARRMVLKP